MPSVAPAMHPAVTQSTGFFASLPAVPSASLHCPGGKASPCVAAAAIGWHVLPVAHWGSGALGSGEQNARSPCFGASIAATTKPFAANSSAPSSICARPPCRPWWKTTSGAHLSTCAGAGQLFVTAAGFGTTISAGTTSIGGLAPGTSSAGSNAPVAVLSRLGVGRLASITSAMLLDATGNESTPYFVNAADVLRTLIPPTKFTLGFFAGSYGAAASCSAGLVIVCVRKVYATAISGAVKGAAPASFVIRFATWTRIRSSAFACESEMPASCDLPPAQSGLVKRRTLPTVGRPRPFPSVPLTRFVTTTAYSAASLRGLLVVSLLAAAGCRPTRTPA